MSKFIQANQLSSNYILGTEQDYDFSSYSIGKQNFYKFKKPEEVLIEDIIECHDGCTHFMVYKTNKGYFNISDLVSIQLDYMPYYYTKRLAIKIGQSWWIEPNRSGINWKVSLLKQKQLF